MTTASEEEQLNRAAGWPIPLCRPFARRHVGGVGDILYNWRIAVLFAHQFRTLLAKCSLSLPRCSVAALWHCGADASLAVGGSALGAHCSSHGVKLSAHQPPKIPSWARTAKSTCGSKPCELIGPDPDLNTQPPRKPAGFTMPRSPRVLVGGLGGQPLAPQLASYGVPYGVCTFFFFLP